MSLTVLLKGGPQFVVTEVHNICEGTKGLIITVRHDILPELRDRATPVKRYYKQCCSNICGAKRFTPLYNNLITRNYSFITKVIPSSIIQV